MYHSACCLCRESLAQLVEAGKKVVDNPVHLPDFGLLCTLGESCVANAVFPSPGAALTSADSKQLQGVLESVKVCDDFSLIIILLL